MNVQKKTLATLVAVFSLAVVLVFAAPPTRDDLQLAYDLGYTSGYAYCTKQNKANVPSNTATSRASSNYSISAYPDGYKQLREQYKNGFLIGFKDRKAELDAAAKK